MDGAATSGHDALGRLVRGHSEYAARKRRLAERLAQLLADYDATPAQQQLLDDAERARSAIARTRATNAARRLLKDIPRKPAPASTDAAKAAKELLERLKGNP